MAEPEISDEEWMRLLAAGDDRALNNLMARWEKRLVSFIMRYTNAPADALDLAQETFLRVYQYRRRFRADGQYSTWMFTIAANLCRSHARWRARHPSLAEEVDRTGEQDETPAPDARAALSDEADLVREAIQELPHDLRTAILLSVYEGMPQAAIASVLGCSAKAVETRLYRARQLLRVSLRSLWDDRRDDAKRG